VEGGVYVVVSIIIVLVAGPANLSRTNERNVLKFEEGNASKIYVSG
jgi:hypothetical protein